MSYLILIIGFVLLIKGADWFVDGSSNIAKKFNVSSIIIGLTIVAFGTSMPEAAVSITAGISGQNDIAMGNIVGSNIFNILVVAGACGVVCPLNVDYKMLIKEFPFSILSVIILLIISTDLYIGQGTSNVLSRADGFILLSFFLIFLYSMIKTALTQKNEATSEENLLSKKINLPLSIGMSIIGVTCIIFGGDLVVDAAVEIATALGVSQNVIGLTIVAIGTSLPELATSVVASRKGERDIAMGNIIGSNLFNVFFVLGASAIAHPINVSLVSIYDIVLLIGISIYSYILAFTGRKITRIEGASLLLIYVVYMVYILMR